MAENKISYVLDLDSTEFGGKINSAIKTVEGLTAAFGSVVKVGAVLTAAYIAVKAALDMTKEAEQIKAINRQFKELSAQAGVSSENIASGLESVADGLIDSTDLIKMANAAIVQLGSNSDKIPEIFELSRKAASVFGQEATQVFETFTQAVASGNTRSLKQFGIFVDTDNAVKQYAASLGVAENALSEAGRRQAVLNAALDQARDKFGNLEITGKESTNALKQISVSFSDIWETITLKFQSVFGPAISMVLQGISGFMFHVSRGLKLLLLDAEEQAAQTSRRVAEEDRVSKEQLAKNEAQFQKELASMRSEQLKARIALTQDEASLAQLQNEQMEILEDQHLAKIAEINEAKHLSDRERQALIDIETQLDLDKKLLMEQENLRQREQMLNNYVNASETAAEGIARSFEAGAARASAAQSNFGAVGQRVFKSFETNSTNALLAFGAGTKSAADAAKGFIFGMLADEAEARGKLMMLASIFPPNPLGIAGGAALIALAGFLRSQGGGGGGGGGGGAAGGGGGAAIASPAGAGAMTEAPSVAENQMSKAVSVVVQGSYFETEQTKTRLIEMIRESSDATNFEIKNIGG